MSTCHGCIHAVETANEICCKHPYQTGRVMSRSLMYDNSTMEFVAGMEWAKNCVYRKNNQHKVNDRKRT